MKGFMQYAQRANIYIEHLELWQHTRLKRIARNAFSAGVKEGKKKQEGRIKELTDLQFQLYCSGYAAGHNDTVEGMYSDPTESPEKWPDLLDGQIQKMRG